MKISLFVVLLVALASTCSALQCYHCTGDKNSDCAKRGVNLVDCGPLVPLCGYYKYEYDNTVHVERSCTASHHLFCGFRLKMANSVCNTCSTDGCNGGASLKINMASLSLIVLGTLFWSLKG